MTSSFTSVVVTLFCILPFSACSEKPEQAQPAKALLVDKIVKRNGISYEINSEEPYTGISYSLYDNGQKREELTYKGGKLHGRATGWYKNGQKKETALFEQGLQQGVFTIWYKNGQKDREVNFKDGNAHGISHSWHENGQKRAVIEFKNGVEIGKPQQWDEQGKPVK